MSWENKIIQWIINIIDNPITAFLQKLWIAIFVVILWYFIINSITNAITKRITQNHSEEEKNEYQEKTADLVWKLIFNILMVLNILLWFQILWFSVWVLMWWVTFWVWFAMQEILWNMIAWVMLITNKKFKIWDIIQIMWNVNIFWKIHKLNIRYTIIKTFDRRKVIIPNIKLISAPIKTFNSEDIIRQELEIAIKYHEDVEKARKVILQEINKYPEIIAKESARVTSSSFYGSWIVIMVYFFNNPKVKSWFVIKSDLRKILLKAFAENSIDYPYDHMVYTVDQNDQNILKSVNSVSNYIKKNTTTQ